MKHLISPVIFASLGAVAIGAAGYVVAADDESTDQEAGAEETTDEESPDMDDDTGDTDDDGDQEDASEEGEGEDVDPPKRQKPSYDDLEPTPETKRPSFANLDESNELAPMDSGKKSGECKCMDPNELRLLMSLRRHREAIDERAALVRKREELLGRLEKELFQKIEEALAEVARIENQLGIGDAARMEDQRRLALVVQTFASMSPKKAAPLLMRSDQRLAVILLRKLGPERASALLAKLEPGRAAQLIRAMAPKRLTPWITGANMGQKRAKR